MAAPKKKKPVLKMILGDDIVKRKVDDLVNNAKWTKTDFAIFVMNESVDINIRKCMTSNYPDMIDWEYVFDNAASPIWFEMKKKFLDEGHTKINVKIENGMVELSSLS
jgi:hypothetical protein